MAKLKLFHSTMNGSKSAMLLTSAFNARRQGKNVILFKPESDSRTSDTIKSRAIKEGMQAIVVPKNKQNYMIDLLTNIETRALLSETSKVDAIYIDELQMFSPSQIIEIAKISILLKIDVFCYGLVLDYMGHIFPSTQKAIECGYELFEIEMQCDYCTEKSTHHLLYVDGEVKTSGHSLFIGDEEFKSVCYGCYTKLGGLV